MQADSVVNDRGELIDTRLGGKSAPCNYGEVGAAAYSANEHSLAELNIHKDITPVARQGAVIGYLILTKEAEGFIDANKNPGVFEALTAQIAKAKEAGRNTLFDDPVHVLDDANKRLQELADDPRVTMGMLGQINTGIKRFDALSSEEWKAVIIAAFSGANGLGIAKQRAVLERFPTPQQLRKASISDLEQINGIGPKLARSIKNTVDQLVLTYIHSVLN